jgi:hypothetical protein
LATPGVICALETAVLNRLKFSLLRKGNLLYIISAMESYPVEKAALEKVRTN